MLLATAIDMGVSIAGYSDSPISAAYPLLRIEGMVTRKDSSGVVRGETGRNQRIGVDEAIEVWTLVGAYATFEQNIKGSIAPGETSCLCCSRKGPAQSSVGYD